MPFVVAIDGPAGTGKGTVTSYLAKKLDLLYIDDKYQNKGIGGKVFKRIRKKVKVIKVRRKNKRAISFYERFGYKVKNKEGDIWYLKEEV